MKIFAVDANKEWKTKLNMVVETIGQQIHWVNNEIELIEKLHTDENSLVLFQTIASDDVYAQCSKISRRFPQITALFVFESKEELDLKKALSSGASNVLFLEDRMEIMKEDLGSVISNHGAIQLSAHPKNAKVITLASTKGGVGKTTLAVNLAVAYRKKVPNVAIIDLDLQFGDVGLFFDVKPRRTIYDWVKEDPHGEEIENFVTPVINGVHILAAPQRPEFAEVITGKDISRAIQALKDRFDIVIVDVASHMDENVLVALENADDILVMTYLDLPTLKNSKLLIDTLASLQLEERVKVILNRNMKVKGIKLDTVEAVVNKKIFTTIPEIKKSMVTAINAGKPLCYTHPRSKAAKQIHLMAEKLSTPSNHLKQKQMTHIIHAGGQA